MEVKCLTSEMMMKRDGIGGNFTRKRDMHSAFVFSDLRCVEKSLTKFSIDSHTIKRRIL